MILYPFLLIALFWMIGLLLGSIITLSKLIIISSLLIGATLLVFSVYQFYKKSRIWVLPLLLGVTILGFTNMVHYQQEHQSILQNYNKVQLQDKTIGVRGYLESNPVLDGDLAKFTISAEQYYLNDEYIDVPTKEKLLIYLYLQKEDETMIVDNWEKGMGIRLYGKLESPLPNTNQGQFNYRAYLKTKDINWRVTATSLKQVKVTKGKWSEFSFNHLQRYLGGQIEQDFHEPYTGFMKGILLGDRNDLANVIKDDFASVGLSHLLAISGLHLSIFTMLLYGLFAKTRLTREITFIIVGVILLSYMLLTGASPSVVRATIMAILTLIGFSYKSPLHALQILGITFIGLTTYKPIWLYDIAFQLSFIVTFFLIWAYPLVYDRISDVIPKRIKVMLTVVIIAQLASFPITYYYFHQYSFISVFANLILVPFFSIVILPLGIINLFFGIFSNLLGRISAKIIMVLLNPFFELIHWLSNIELFRLYGHFSLIALVVAYIILFWFLFRKKVKNAFISFHLKKRINRIELIVIILLIIVISLAVFPNKEGKITFIDVGQGDSILIETPEQYHILIDSGGTVSWDKEEWQQRKKTFNVGADVVLPFLHYQGINKIDLAIITHEDADHINGFSALIEGIKINRFLVNEQFPRTENGRELLMLLDQKGIPVTQIKQEKTVKTDQFTDFTFIPINIKGSEKENDHIIVTLLNMFDTKIIFTGDLEEVGEDKMLSNYNIEPVDILKIGHHGSTSSTSNELLDTIQPKDAVISVGRNNRYHHPSLKVVNRLEEKSINIWRTDKQGSIIIEVDNNGYQVDTLLRE